MTLSHHTSSSGSRTRLKQRSALAYSICFILAAVDLGCLWKWFDLHPMIDLTKNGEVFSFVGLVLLPGLILFGALKRFSSKHDMARERIGYHISLEQLQKRLSIQENFLQAITDNDDEAIVIFDKNNNYWFANSCFAKSLKRDPKDIVGLSPAQILDMDRSRQVVMTLDKVRRTLRPIDALEKIQDLNGSARYIQTHYKILDAFNDFSGGVLLREEDVTNLVMERERRENMLRQVLEALVAVVDRRDPYASGHSARVGQLSRMIAEEMVLTEREIEAAEVAGSLMNFGKVLVSRGILTKTSALTADELQRVRDSILTSAEILSIIDFSTPVVPTLKQVLERVDGSGVPQGLKGAEIIVTARIVAVANTYVALVSPRAHRPSLGLKEAISYMMQDVDKIYDRAVVKALAHFIENRSNKLDWLTASKQD